MPAGAGPQGGATNPNNPYVAGSSLSPAIVAMLKAGNFNGAFQSALSQSTADMPGMSQLQELLTPERLQASGVNWNQGTMDAYYSALNNNQTAIQKDNNVLKSLGTIYNPQIGSGNGGNSQYLNGTFGPAPKVTDGNYVPNPIGTDFKPTFQNGHMGGALGDIANAASSTAITVGQAALIAGMAYAGGMGGGALAGVAGAGSGTLGAALGTGIGSGAVGSAASDVVHNQPLTLGSVGKGAALGAITGGLGYAASPATSALSSYVNPTIANGLVRGTIGAGVGAVGSALNGGNPAHGALVSGLSAAAGSFAASGAGSLGASSGIASSIGKVVGSGVGALVGGTPQNNNVSNGVNAGLGALGTAGALAGNGNMSTSDIGSPTSNTNTGLGIGNSLLGTIGGIVGNYGAIQQGNANGNVLSNAQAGTGIGTNTGYTGPNGTASIHNGQVQTGLTGGLGQTNTNVGNFGAQQSQIAGSFNGMTPGNVQGAINSQSMQQAPQGTQGALGFQQGLQGQVQNSQMGLMGAGTNAFNNPLTGNFQQAAQQQLGTAGSDFTNTYNTQLSALNAQLARPAAQAESQLNDAEFGRGQLGTSGGGLQTQAFAQGLGQAFMGNQQTAYNEAMNAQNSATNNAATLNNAGNSNLNTANSLLANAYGQFNNTSALNTNTANSIFNQNSQISQLGNQYGQQNLNNQITSAALPAQLAGAYGQNANQAIQGAQGLNNIGMSGFNAALGAGTQQGNQYNGAMRNAVGLAGSNVSTNGLGGVGNMLNGIGGTNLLGGIGSAFNALTGGGQPNYSGQDSNMFGGNAANYNGYIPDNGGATYIPGDIGFGDPNATGP